MKNYHKYTNLTNNKLYWRIVETLLLLLSICLYVLMFLHASPAFASPITESRLIQLTNQERLTRGLNVLNSNPLLYFAAKEKAQDMIEKDYFDHYTPYGKSPWDFIHSNGYQYLMAGENLAMDFKTSEGIHSAWMTSSTHRDNIIRPEYEDIAIAVANGDFDGHKTSIIVQMFGKQNTNIVSEINSWVLKIRDFILGF